MFEKFGEFDSAEELCELANNLFNEGDFESIKALAEENGIEGIFVDAYIDGFEPTFCDLAEAAVGKIEVEQKDMKLKDIMVDWAEYIKTESMEDDDLAKAVRRKGKTLKGCIGALLKWAFAHQHEIDKEILTAAGVKAQKVTLGMPGRAEAQKIIREYYMGKAK